MRKNTNVNENINELELAFRKNFKKVRKENGYTQKTLAEKTDMVRETIARIESGQVSPQVTTIIKLLEPIGYTLDIVKLETEDDDDDEGQENN